MWQRIAGTTILAGVSILIFSSCCLPEAPQILKLAPWLSIVKEYFRPTEAFVDQSKWARLPSGAGDQGLPVVDLLEEGNVQATFFVLAWVSGEQLSHSAVAGQYPPLSVLLLRLGIPLNVNLSKFARGVWCAFD